jgi:SAM-dependent methyltransferase
MMERYLVPVYLPKGLYEGLRHIKRALTPTAATRNHPDLSGDRDIEWSYIASRLPTGPGYVLDFGCGYGQMSIHAVQKGYRILAIDLESNPFPWSHPNVEVVCGDILQVDLTQGAFDFILNCSTVEHVGLVGRYGVQAREGDGDLAAMQRLRTLLKPSGKMLMTIPCGQDAAIAPWHRVYGKERLPKLLSDYEIEEEMYWVKRADNRWRPSNKGDALEYLPTSHPTIAVACSYALGCFVLRPNHAASPRRS